MRQKPGTRNEPAEKVVKDIRQRMRKRQAAEEKIRIVLENSRGEDSIAWHCRREGIATSLYYGRSKGFLVAGKKRLAGDTARQATSPEGNVLRHEAIARFGSPEIRNTDQGSQGTSIAWTGRLRRSGLRPALSATTGNRLLAMDGWGRAGPPLSLCASKR